MPADDRSDCGDTTKSREGLVSPNGLFADANVVGVTQSLRVLNTILQLQNV